MTPEDVKTIFNNITELAVFSDALCERLQDAIALDGDDDEDRVGTLFLEIVSITPLFFNSSPPN
jgi:dynamin-binding protein